MLVLTRKSGQCVRIGDDIVVTVLKVTRRGEIRLGFDAPRDITIAREDPKP